MRYRGVYYIAQGRNVQNLRHTLTAILLLISTGAAHADGIAGNRFFVGTLTFDDPAVADEAILPASRQLR
jgi:hypothetical protein